MRLSCSQKKLTNALSFVGRGVGNNTLPVLNNVYLKAEKNRLYLATTNLEIAVQYSIEAKVEVEGETTMPAKLLGGYVGYLKDGDLSLNLGEGNDLMIQSNDSKTTFKGISADEFPAIPEVESEHRFSMDRVLFLKALQQVSFAASLNTTRPILSGVYMAIENGEMVMAATDSYRLAEKRLPVSVDFSLNCVVPIRTVLELQSLLTTLDAKEIEVVVAKNQILFSIGGLSLTSRLVEGQYPQYQAVIPKDQPTLFEVSNQDFSMVLKRLNLFAKENNFKVLIRTQSSGVTLTTPQTQMGVEEVTIPVSVTGPDAELAINSQFVLDVVSNIGADQIEFKLGQSTTPLMILAKGQNDYLHIVMPLKV